MNKSLISTILISVLMLSVNSCYNQKNYNVAEKETEGKEMGNKEVKTDEEWKKILTPEQYSILREKGTERAFTGEYWNTFENGVYKCGGCGEVLFASETKFESGCGWPSFYQPVDSTIIKEHDDFSFAMNRVEVLCSKCGGHLGHVFEDGPNPTGLRYCINSAALRFEKK